MIEPITYSAFLGDQLLGHGSLASVLGRVKSASDCGEPGTILIFDDSTGKAVDFDLRGTLDEVLERAAPRDAPKGPGRPRLGVESREVTLLPRHWAWLQAQPSGASAALRRLVEEASRREPDAAAARRDAAYHFMSAMSGDRPGFEEASRALFAGDLARLQALAAAWPVAIRDHLFRLLETR